MPGVDWQDLFARYVTLVREYEGADFLGADDWSPQEWAAITELVGPADWANDDADNRAIRWADPDPERGVTR